MVLEVKTSKNPPVKNNNFTQNLNLLHSIVVLSVDTHVLSVLSQTPPQKKQYAKHCGIYKFVKSSSRVVEIG